MAIVVGLVLKPFVEDVMSVPVYNVVELIFHSLSISPDLLTKLLSNLALKYLKKLLDLHHYCLIHFSLKIAVLVNFIDIFLYCLFNFSDPLLLRQHPP